jgi:hypothetical protein
VQLKRDIEDKYGPEKKQAHKAAKQLLSDNPEAGNKKKDLSRLSSAGLDVAEKAGLSQLDALQSLHDTEIDAVIDCEEMRLLIEKKYKDIRETGDKKEFDRKVQPEQMNALLSAYSSYVQAEEAAVSAKYDKEIKAAGKILKKSKSSKRKKRKSRPKSGRNTGTNHLPSPDG